MSRRRKAVALALGAGVAVLAVIGVTLAVRSGGDTAPTSPATPAQSEPTRTAATETPSKAQLLYCPPEVGEAVCDFAAAAEGWLQRREVGQLVDSGGPMDTPEERAALLRTIETGFAATGSVAPTLRSIACPVGRDPTLGILPASCDKNFTLVFATVNEGALPESGGVISLGYSSEPRGPQLVGHLVAAPSERAYLLRGPNANGCPVAGTAQNPEGCAGVKVYPVEVLAPGRAPAVVGGTETIGGVEVKQLRMGGEAALPKDFVVYLSPVPYATDSNPVLLWRVYKDGKGEIRRDDLFANLKQQFGPLAIVSWVGDERMAWIVVVSCPETRCRGVSVGGWEGEFEVHASEDGGMTWHRFPPVPGSAVPATAFPAAITAEGVLMRHFLGHDAEDGIRYRFFLHPTGQEVVAPGLRVTPRIVPGFGLAWEWDETENRGYAPIPGYDATGSVLKQTALTPNLQARLIARTPDGSIYATWRYVKDRATDPHPPTDYVGRIDSNGKPMVLFTPGPIDLVVFKRPFFAGADLLLTNVNLPATSGPFDVPAALVDLKSGLVQPVRELSGGLVDNQQPFVSGVVPGAVVRVATGGDCLNVRDEPSVTATSLGCFKDAVLLADRGQSTSVGAITWVAVSTPDGRPGWASAEFLER
ncbi:MAG: hypothetical protein C0506_02620 [Anaerolinea sp.]|nr:hypothetical protein [Anaerolinea sp.]